MNRWDITLLLVVSLQATIIAYLQQPRAKALLLSFPFPFSLAFLALGQPVDATNVLGLLFLLAYFHAVRWLFVHAGSNIVVAIVGSALLYGIAGASIASVLPRTALTFWLSAVTVVSLAVLILCVQPHRDEPPHRSPLPVYLKLPLIMATITILILAKHWLHGFMTVFPMVGLIAAYEARYSLWTMTRQVPVIMIAMGIMMIVMRLAQIHMEPAATLAAGWLAFAAVLPLLQRRHGRSKAVAAAGMGETLKA